MATILVTGGCGFIGSHLCAALRARGDRVRVLDDLSTGHEANLVPGASLLIGDVSNAETVRQAVAGVDAVFHLAAVASVERGVQDWYGTHRINLSGTIAVLDAARHSGIPVVYASSAAVYGDADALPLHEGTQPRPLSAYGADKLGCEQHARVAGHTHGVPTAGLRFFNVYGPRQDPNSPYSGVISIFCDRISQGQSVQVFGDGLQTRDFVYVGDVVRMLLAALPAASVSAPVFNVCSGQPTSVLDLASLVAELCGVPLDVQHRPSRSSEIRHSLGQPALAREKLMTTASVSLRDGLAETLAWLSAGRPGLSEQAGPFRAIRAA
ncbi:NAD-dependent epimerase/dehydratase family protein [Roseomonas marmotae]|uniref:NAD-dependent epimerase/dehydratase family protein n=1 Tax=Roseomonas marmotae TaxID=2768161 RepID=A0ABS3KH18_9PROT|nr:NAD-dependent epimerase/dehydratase family protein [Roseomonas marmotae]MBO1076771.1 NAD-dependent epimerase/dehydratase family protein [Roseomonas marmotae]QTI78701.1 NAD-dependent epimerase/dehydratase family protein [Roseomonas marmotae]